LLARHRFDIVLTDIRMPGMDGMALLERIRASWPECRVIFLTGHREFDYAYKAIQFKGLQYILKTEGYARVISAVKQAISEIDDELKMIDRMDTMRRRADTADMFLQKELFTQVLAGNQACFPDDEELQEYGIDLRTTGQVLMIAGRFSQNVPLKEFTERTRYCHTVKMAAEQYLSPHMRFICFPDELSDVIILAQPKESFSLAQGEDPVMNWNHVVLFVKETLELMQASIRRALDCSISFGLDSVTDFQRDMGRIYESINRMMATGISVGEEMLLTGSLATSGSQYPDGAVEPDWSRKSKTGMLSLFLDRGDRAAFEKTFDALVQVLEKPTDGNSHQSAEIYYSIALIILTYLNRWHLHETISQIADPGMLMNAGIFPSWQKAVQYLRRMSSLLFNVRQMDRHRHETDVLTRLKAHIDSHLGEDLSLLRLSELMFFNPSYLSRLFKQLSGVNLTNYIQGKRIERAMEMLGKKETRVNDIAMALGFGSATNFSRFFKKAAGITPVEYRDTL
jgi:two-component system response regulator YesN